MKSFIDIVPGLMTDYIADQLKKLPKESFVQEIVILPSGGGGKNVSLIIHLGKGEKKDELA